MSSGGGVYIVGALLLGWNSSSGGHIAAAGEWRQPVAAIDGDFEVRVQINIDICFSA